MASNRQLVVEIIGDDRKLQRTYKTAATSTTAFNRNLEKGLRGAAAGSGLFRSLGRSLAFASGGFLAVASGADLLHDSIQQASEAAAVQRQLGAQFKAAGQDLSAYQQRIDAAANSLSQLAGIEDDQLKAAFVTAFRGSQNVSAALKIQAAAADVARGRHIDLQTATIALTKAYGGQTTALRRLGIQVPGTLHGLAAINFVQARFAGQAKAGTTEADRFNAALKNFEQAIGTGILPILNKYLSGLSKWLNNTENQRKVQERVAQGASILGKTLHGLGQLYHGLVDPIAAVTKKVDQLNRAFNEGAKRIYQQSDALSRLNGEEARFRGFAPALARQTTGEDVRLRGAGAINLQTTTRTHQRASLTYQLSILQERLAKAELTAGTKDERAVLVRIAALTRQKIAKTKDLADRTRLYQSLGSVEEQIRAIDEKAATDKKARQEKELERRRKEQADFQTLVDKANQQVQEYARKMRERARQQREALKSAITSVRSELGGLFSQDLLGAADARKGILGVGQPGVGSIVGSITAQTKQAVGFFNDLARIRKRGATAGTVAELRSGGLGSAELVHTIATASRGQFQSFLKATAQREKVIQQIAHADVRAQTVVVHAGNLRMSRSTPVTQRSGRQAGVPSSIGSFINP